MIEDISNAWINLFLWSLLPSFATKFLLAIFYKMAYSESSHAPKAGSTQYKKHYYRTYCIVIFSYFLYCVGDCINGLPTNYYRKMGISRLNSETELKPRFRSLMMSLHPDKVPDADPQKFLEIKQIYEVLENKDLKSCYEVFGEEVMRMANESSKKSSHSRFQIRDYLENAFIHWGIYYIGSIGVLLLMSFFSMNIGMYWRVIGMLSIGGLELFIISRPDFWKNYSFIDQVFFIANFTVHEKLLILRSVVTNGLLVFSHIVNFSFEKQKDLATEKRALLEGIYQILTKSINVQVDDLLNEIKTSFKDEPELQKRLLNSLQMFSSNINK